MNEKKLNKSQNGIKKKKNFTGIVRKLWTACPHYINREYYVVI